MNSKQIIISLILVALLGMVASNTFSIAGFTTTGISKADFQSYDSILNGEVWVINIIQGGLSQSIYGSIAPNYQDTEGGSERTEKGFSLDITHSNQQLEYPIIIDYSAIPIYKIDYDKYSIFDVYGLDFVQQYCGEDHGAANVINVYKPAFSSYQYCVYRIPLSSRPATFNNKILTFNTEFEMKIGDRTYTETISTTQRGSLDVTTIVKFTDNYYGDVAYAKWLGNLVTGDEGTTPAGIYLATFYDNKWNIIKEQAYDDYSTYYKNNVLLSASVSEDELNIIKSRNNMNADTALNDWTFTTLNDEIATTEGTEGSGKVIVDLNTPLQYPTFVVYVSADDVKGIGVYQPVAKPKVLSVSDIIFKTGETGYVDVRIQNIGEERGGFETSVSCSNHVTMVGVPKYTTLSAGESISLTIPVTGQTTTQSTCTVTTSVMGITDSKTFNAEVSAQQICTPYAQICLDGVSSSCKSDGSGFVEDGDDARCIAQEERKGDIIDIPSVPSLDDLLDGQTSMINTILIVVLLIIFFAVALLMVYGIVKAVIIAKLT